MTLPPATSGTRRPVAELRFSCVGVIKNVDQLTDLYNLFLFGETLEHLCEMGSAYEDDPNIDLK